MKQIKSLRNAGDCPIIERTTCFKERQSKWQLGALLPLGLALSTISLAAEPVSKTRPADAKDQTLPTVKVKATRETQPNVTEGYVAITNSTAVKTDTALINLPQSVTIITSELIRDLNMQSIADSLRYVPGVGMAQGEGNRDTPIFAATVRHRICMSMASATTCSISVTFTISKGSTC